MGQGSAAIKWRDLGKRCRVERGRKLQLFCRGKKGLQGDRLLPQAYERNSQQAEGEQPLAGKKEKEASLRDKTAADRAAQGLAGATEMKGSDKKRGSHGIQQCRKSPGQFGPTAAVLVLGRRGTTKETGAERLRAASRSS